MPRAEEPRQATTPRVDGWPFDTARAKELQAQAKHDETCDVDLGNGATLNMTLIPAGQFVIGDNRGHQDETPATAATIAEPFLMGTFEVSNAQFAEFDPTHDSRLEAYPGNTFSTRVRGQMVNGPDQPVCRVSQIQAREFCRWLSKKTGRQFDLPTEAQWEYACRAGTDTALWFGMPGADHGAHANLADKSSQKVWHLLQPGESIFDDKAFASAEVGSYAPNPWGLHDMHGNVAEWTRSPYHAYPYAWDMELKPGDKVVARGGSWNDFSKDARSAYRLMYRPHERVYDVGFRVVCKP